MRLLVMTMALLALAAQTASASAIPMQELPARQIVVTAGLPGVGLDVGLGKVSLGVSAYGLVIPQATGGYAGLARGAWRIWGLPAGEANLAIAAVGGWGSYTLGIASYEGSFWHSGLSLYLPLGEAASFKLMVGPLLYAGVMGSGYSGMGTANQVIQVGSGMLAFVPNAELALRVHPRHEIVIGGLPNVLAWRGRF